MLLARHACRVLVPLRSCPRKQASTTGSPLEPVPAKAGTGMSGLCCAFGYRLSSVMAGLRPGHDAEGVACTSVQPPVFHIQLSNSSARRLAETCVITRILCRGPGQACLPSRFLTPRQSEGDGAPSDATIYSLCARVPSRKHGGASRRATRTSSRRPGLFAGVLLTAPGRAFRWPFQLAKRTIRQPSSWRAALVGHQTGSRCRPGACLRGTPAGAASLLHHQTPLDDAPR